MSPSLGNDSGLVTSTSGSVNPSLPSGWSVDDFLCMHLVHGSTAALSAPGGWQIGDDVAFNSTHHAAMLWKFADPGESAPTFTGTTTNGMWGVLSSWKGVPRRADPFDVDPIAAAVSTSGGAIPGATTTTTIDGGLVVWLYAQSDNGTTSTVSGGGTAAYNGSSYSSVVGIDSNLSAAYKAMPTQGATGAVNMTTSSGVASAVIRFAFDPTPALAMPPLLRPEQTRFRHLLPR